MLAGLAGMCKYTRTMSDDLIPTATVAALLNKSVATINRWAAEGREDTPQPALTLPGDTGARLYRRADVEAYKATQDALKAKHQCCPNCDVPTWHNGDGCPSEPAVAS